HASDHISLGQMREFIYLNDVSHYVFILDRHLVCQPGHGWTVRSRRCDEDLNMKILLDRVKRFDRCLRQLALPLRSIQKTSEQNRELVAGWHSKVPNCAFYAIRGDDKSGNTINGMLPRQLALGHEIVHFQLDLV